MSARLLHFARAAPPPVPRIPPLPDGARRVRGSAWPPAPPRPAIAEPEGWWVGQIAGILLTWVLTILAGAAVGWAWGMLTR